MRIQSAFTIFVAIATTVVQMAAGPASAEDEHGFFNPLPQQGEDRWVPSGAIMLGFTAQGQSGWAASAMFEGNTPPPVPLGGDYSGSDSAVSPFVGVDLQLMSPALPVPGRPRFFFGAEILPTFAVDRDLAFDGAPGCIRGPEVTAPCAQDEVPGTRRRPFGETAANGKGTRTTAQVQPLVYGLTLGAAFPFEIAERDLRFKPLVGFLSYRVNASGLVVDALCDPVTACTDFTPIPSGPTSPGFLREVDLTASGARRFYSVGPGFDVEMDAGRFGQVGAALFTGMRAYKVFGDRTITYGTETSYDDQIGQDTAFGQFEVQVDPWIYRAHVGIRFQWLGKE